MCRCGKPGHHYCRTCGDLTCDYCSCSCFACGCPCHGDEAVIHAESVT